MAKAELITTLHKGANTDIDVFPNIKKENIPNASIDESKLDPALLQKITPVVANPTIVGSEADLTSIQVGDTKYKVTGGGGGGTSVSGTNDGTNWTSLTIESDTYAIPQGMDITAQEIATYFEVCDVDASVTTEGDDVVLNLTNADIVTENRETVLTTEVPNVSVQNNILEIE